jgi:putative oxidoreductase
MGEIMEKENEIKWSLFFLRVSVFVVMLFWMLDKFVRPEHASVVYEHFYGIGGLSETAFTIIGLLELLLLAAFVSGSFKRLSYGLVLVIHAISTLSSYAQYLDPFKEVNLLFFAAWPMLAACIALYLLRDLDTRWTSGWGQ